MGRLFILIANINLVLLSLFLISCVHTDMANQKVSSLLATQINLRQEQIAEPTPDRLEMMKGLGMRVDNLEIQRIFIYLTDELNSSQIDELRAAGIILYLDSWVPPVGAHPTGFITADMPIDQLQTLVEKDCIVRLDTAERVLQPKVNDETQLVTR